MTRQHIRAAACVLASIFCIMTAACAGETYTDNPTVDAIKIAEQARWAQTFSGGIVVYVKTAEGSEYSPDEAVCIARLSDGTQPHVVINPKTERCYSVDGAR